MPAGKVTRSPAPNEAGAPPPPSGVTVTSPSSSKHVSFSLYVHGNFDGSHDHVGQRATPKD